MRKEGAKRDPSSLKMLATPLKRCGINCSSGLSSSSYLSLEHLENW